MENAVKALVIIGGILFALILITAFLYINSKIINYKNAEEENIRIENLRKFNQEYEVYYKKYLYGAELISLIHKMQNNNYTYKDDEAFQITWEPKSFNDETINKTEIFTCTGIEYSSETGRVSKMTFRKVDDV